MCGIVGLAGLEVSPERARSIVLGMNARIAHRGPDGDGIIGDEGATLAMKRLAIVDIEHGQQPMTTEDGAITLVYNGEVYNAAEIRERLEAEGVAFRTRSDTEVILRLYERDPDDVERHLVGMWAFAIYDRRRRRLVLSRDRFGIKPLFVADTGTAIAFASELRCFDRSLEPFTRLFELDHAAAHAMVAWSYIPETATIYRGVHRVPPATRLTVDLASGARQETTYWSLRPSGDAARIGKLDDACASTEALLRRAVREHLASDVPVATFLSGGIDSSLVSAYAADAAPSAIRAFTIGFDDPRFDESPFARETADLLGIPISVDRFDETTARSKLADALLAYDEPFGDSSSLATFLLSSHVAKSYKVALGGDGGDEVFAGYKKYRVMHLRAPLGGAPRVRDALGRALAAVPLVGDRTRGWTEVLRTVRRLARGLVGEDARVYAQLTQVASLAETAPLLASPGGADAYEEEAMRRFGAAHGDDLQRTLATDLRGMLPNDMLVKVDRASMACHLEARVPFLDHRLVEHGVGLPRRFTLGRPTDRPGGKSVLRALHQRRFGPALARRRKQGFGVPVERWLRGPFDAACERLFEARKLDRFGLLSSRELGGGGFRAWVARHPLLLWHAFALAAWCEANLGEGPDALRETLRT